MEPIVLEQSLDESAALLQVTEVQTGLRVPSYHPTPWALVNHVLDRVDLLTNGRAGLLQKFFSFAFIGGCAALVNLACYWVLLYKIALPGDFAVRETVAYLLAFEISIIANFIPNDYFTFRYAPGRERSWLMRCLRFNITCIGGCILTYLIHLGFIVLHLPPIIAEAGALILVMFYNFAFHHIFTYRKVKTAL